jgi:SOS-response transcriptional repressor LexA
MKPTLAQRLKAARAAIHPEITQRQIAKELDLSPSAVNLWEAGKTEPSAGDLAKLSARYKVSTDWLLGADNAENLPAQAHSAKTINTVPIVPPSSMVRWSLENSEATLLQTTVAYPQQTAAAMLVTSDSLASVCPSGSYAVISKGHQAEPGRVVLATIGNSTEPVLRKYIREGSENLLVSDDVRFPSYRLDDGVNIIGCVTEIIIRKVLI